MNNTIELFTRLCRLYDEMENHFPAESKKSTLALMIEAGYSDTEANDLYDKILKIYEDLDNILPGLEMQINGES